MYNATVSEIWADGTIGTFVAEVQEIGGTLQMVRGNSVTCTGLEGKIVGDVALYDAHIRKFNPDKTYKIVLDNCEGYKKMIAGMFGGK